ncbi:hypothetical protein ACVXG7_31145 [Enterobacter hormaechei]
MSTQSLRLVRSILMLVALLSVIYLWSRSTPRLASGNISLWDVTSTVQEWKAWSPSP